MRPHFQGIRFAATAVRSCGGLFVALLPARMAPSSNFLGPPELLPLENAEFAVLRVLEHFKEVPYLLKQVSGHIGDVPAKWAAWPMCMATDEVILMKLGPRRGL